MAVEREGKEGEGRRQRIYRRWGECARGQWREEDSSPSPVLASNTLCRSLLWQRDGWLIGQDGRTAAIND